MQDHDKRMKAEWRHVGDGFIEDQHGNPIGQFIGDFRKRDELIVAVNAPKPEPLSLWRVYVLKPKAPGARKHSVRIYRVGAASREQAIEEVRQQIIIEQDGRTSKIVAAARFSGINAALYDGSVEITPAELQERGYDKADL